MASTDGRFRARTAWIHAASAVARDRALTGVRKVLGLSADTSKGNVSRKLVESAAATLPKTILTPYARPSHVDSGQRAMPGRSQMQTAPSPSPSPRTRSTGRWKALSVRRVRYAGERPREETSCGTTSPSRPSTFTAATSSARVGPRLSTPMGISRSTARYTNRRPE